MFDTVDVKSYTGGMNYTRVQTGHSITLHLLFGGFLLWIPTVYYAVSPNHFFHL